MSRPRMLTNGENRRLSMIANANARAYAPHELAQLLAEEIRRFYTPDADLDEHGENPRDFGATVYATTCPYLENRSVPTVMYWTIGDSAGAVPACWLYLDRITNQACMILNDV